MGLDNNHLIRSTVDARKKYGVDSPQFRIADCMVGLTQSACSHPKEFQRTRDFKKDFSVIKAGETATWCVRCSKLLEKVPTPPMKRKLKS